MSCTSEIFKTRYLDFSNKRKFYKVKVKIKISLDIKSLDDKIRKPAGVGKRKSDSEAIEMIVKRWRRENKSDIENRIAENECE